MAMTVFAALRVKRRCVSHAEPGWLFSPDGDNFLDTPAVLLDGV
ncbi:hypothetical protein [Paraburkholderia fungorum]